MNINMYIDMHLLVALQALFGMVVAILASIGLWVLVESYKAGVAQRKEEDSMCVICSDMWEYKKINGRKHRKKKNEKFVQSKGWFCWSGELPEVWEDKPEVESVVNDSAELGVKEELEG